MMTKATESTFEVLRDSAATLPEFEDLNLEMQTFPRSRLDEMLDEALMESFPASDPPASGRFE
ncbi:hypothetical protein AAIH70_16250 [Neorhizobium sp. BT27B]|uniref:hypothetical protein n=1 Tax=Neorhizobium sp. BT27B TaxID=3142625 RepID=UPI003D27216C